MTMTIYMIDVRLNACGRTKWKKQSMGLNFTYNGIYLLQTLHIFLQFSRKYCLYDVLRVQNEMFESEQNRLGSGPSLQSPVSTKRHEILMRSTLDLSAPGVQEQVNSLAKDMLYTHRRPHTMSCSFPGNIACKMYCGCRTACSWLSKISWDPAHPDSQCL